jgi:all-trans-8'-apo-beta-carotenal 15,15'-oxygenase
MTSTTLLSRRSALAALAMGAGGAALPAWAAGCDNPAASFANQRNKPWTMGYTNMVADVAPMTLKVRGRIPKEAMGAFYRNGPARHALGDKRYTHWFDGDGALQRYILSTRGVQHHARYIQTAKFAADNAAGTLVREGFGTRDASMPPTPSADAINVANTSVVHHGGRLLALWEGGSAYEMDAATLHTKGPHRWSDASAGMPFSAHPRIEPDGTMWNFGVSSMAGALVIYRISKDGKLSTTAVQRIPDVAMVHDFAVTQNHLVFLLPPLIFQTDRYKGGASFLDSHVWTPKLGLRVLLLPKNQLDQPRWYELPAGMVFHLGSACEVGGVLRLDCMRAPSAWGATDGQRDVMCGDYQPQEHAQAMVVELDLASKRARQTVLPLVAEFPRVDPRFVAQPYTQVFAATRMSARPQPGFDSIARWNVQTGAVDRYHYGDHVLVEEHVFIPAAGTGSPVEGRGFLVGTAMDLKQQQMLLSVFDAQNIAAGPLMQASMDRTMPLGLHGCHVPLGA